MANRFALAGNRNPVDASGSNLAANRFLPDDNRFEPAANQQVAGASRFALAVSRIPVAANHLDLAAHRNPVAASRFELADNLVLVIARGLSLTARFFPWHQGFFTDRNRARSWPGALTRDGPTLPPGIMAG